MGLEPRTFSLLSGRMTLRNWVGIPQCYCLVLPRFQWWFNIGWFMSSLKLSFSRNSVEIYHVVTSDQLSEVMIRFLVRSRAQWSSTVLIVIQLPTKDNGKLSHNILCWLTLDNDATGTRLNALKFGRSHAILNVLGLHPVCEVVDSHPWELSC